MFTEPLLRNGRCIFAYCIATVVDATLLKWMLRKRECKDVDWIHLDQGRDQLWGHVNTVMNLRVSLKGEEFLDQLSDY
jgi:hypothetical protein